MNCCGITPGMLTRRISIERLTTTPDALGGFAESWAAIAMPYAHIKPMSGRELVNADKLDALAVSRFVIRYRSDLRESDRVNYRGTRYNIRSIVNINERDEWLEITAERGVAQ